MQKYLVTRVCLNNISTISLMYYMLETRRQILDILSTVASQFIREQSNEDSPDGSASKSEANETLKKKCMEVFTTILHFFRELWKTTKLNWRTRRDFAGN